MNRLTGFAVLIAIAGSLAVQGCERRSTADELKADFKEGANDARRAVDDATD